MPKLGQYQSLLNSVFFLYPDEASARAGRGSGGTGFFVAINSKVPGYHYIYAVTNWHVALGSPHSQPCPVLRVNSSSGPPMILPYDPADWEFLPGKYDIAVLPIKLDLEKLKIALLVADGFFMTEAEVVEQELNAGEDVFMLGRFIDYDGIEENCPSMRFGNISMMRAQQRQPTGYVGDSIVVDMHSRTGYSGSPVFVYRTTGSLFAEEGRFVFGHMLRLLGILWGSYPEEWEIKVRTGEPAALSLPVMTGSHSIRGMSGMSLVCPAWNIMEVLNMNKLRIQRLHHETALLVANSEKANDAT